MTERPFISSVCSPLMDFLVQVDDDFLAKHDLHKGTMLLADEKLQQSVMESTNNSSPTRELGGTCLNAIRILSILGNQTKFMGCIGEDEVGNAMAARMKDLGIQDHSVKSSDHHSGTCFVLITPDGERTMVTHLGAASQLNQNQLNDDFFKKTSIFHLSGYMWTLPNLKEAAYASMKKAKENGCLVSLDVADPFVVQNFREELLGAINDYADIVFANEEETNMLVEGTLEQQAAKLKDMTKIAVLKRGSKGAVIIQGEKRFDIEPCRVDVVDTTGAGDSFAAGFLHSYAAGKDLTTCGNNAALIAADIITKVGVTLNNKVIPKIQ